MIKKYISGSVVLIMAFLLLIISSCKKDNTTTKSVTPPTTAAAVKLGMYEEAELDTIYYRACYMVVNKMGTQTLPDSINGLIFDTGSGGLVIDASGIIPSSMITDNGFNFTGDSTVIDGITITNQTQSIVYGDDAASDETVYGNLAYADVVIGEPTDATITVKRLPFFLYYKAVDGKGNKVAAHEFDVLGVNSEYDLTFNNGVNLQSPFEVYSPGTGLTKGFKMDALGTANFSTSDEVPLTSGVVTVGLTADDISSSSAYKFTTLVSDPPYGYPPILKATIDYDSKTDVAAVVFDSGTDPYNYLEDSTAPTTTTTLAANTSVSVTATTSGFNYPFVTSSTDYLTFIENPSVSQTDVSILSLEYFLNNGYLIDYTDHKLGLKNN